jgi:solute carrier family 25 citrate transporter 1
MSPPSSSKNADPLVSFLAGGTAGGVEATVTYPFEFAKTRVQLRAVKGQEIPKNPLRVIGQVIHKEGFRSLYTGCSTLVVGTIAKDSIRFLIFDSIKNAISDPQTHTLSPVRSLAAGLASGVVVSTLVVTPTEVVKTALIDNSRNTATKPFKNPWHAIKSLIKQHGPLALYRGYVTTTLKAAGTTSVRFGSYNILKDLSKSYDLPQNSGTDFLKGMCAGIITTYVTQPIDTVKTRAQSVRAMGAREAIQSVWQDYGIRGFWKGTTMRLGRTICAGGILFTVYEKVSSVLQAARRKKEAIT